jgi:hypothetical protein
MKQNPNSTPEPPGETPAVNAPASLGICIVDGPPAPARTANPPSSGATACQAAQHGAPPPANHGSVVSKVAKLLTRRRDLEWDYLTGWEDGFIQHKVQASLQAKQPL